LRPSRSLARPDSQSVKKNGKIAPFMAEREEIERSASEFGIPLEHVKM
jgi:hypothetical protein